MAGPKNSRMADLTLDPASDLSAITNLLEDENLGRLNTTSTMGISNGCDPSQLPAELGDLNGDTNVDVDDVKFYVENNCEYDTLYSYGARSFSIWSELTASECSTVAANLSVSLPA